MDQIKELSDVRLGGRCAFCGNSPDTRDHCPSRVFLDSPYPENVAVVPACFTCNNGFSKDEEYLACLLGCTISGTTDPEAQVRHKIAALLRRQEKLLNRIELSRFVANGATFFRPEIERVKGVVKKLARGHWYYETAEQADRDPDHVWIAPLSLLNGDELGEFEKVDLPPIYPEIGSRAFQRLCVGRPGVPYFEGWIEVQSGNYRYAVVWGGSLTVKIVIHEYLACVCEWIE